jgi:hypothetical protein
VDARAPRFIRHEALAAIKPRRVFEVLDFLRSCKHRGQVHQDSGDAQVSWLCLQAAPPLLASLDLQIVRRQRVSAAAMAWNTVTPGFAAIDIGEVDDRSTISRDQLAATV